LPNLLSFPTSCVCLELRSLSSTGITRHPRSYEPRRHPKAPGLSLTGLRLVIPAPRQGASRVACVFLVYMLSPLPRHSDWGCCFAHFPQSCQPSPKWRSGRPVQRPFRGLLSVYSRYGLHTRQVTKSDPLHQRLQPFRYLHDCSDCFRPEQNCRVGLSPTGKRRLCTAHTQMRHSQNSTAIRQGRLSLAFEALPLTKRSLQI